MKIDEAIEKLNHLLDPSYFLISTDERNAVKLGIEALKCVKVLLIIPDKRINLELPGETKD